MCTQATALRSFVEEAVALCKPDAVHLVDGSDAENEMLLGLLEGTGTLVKLNPALRPGCYVRNFDIVFWFFWGGHPQTVSWCRIPHAPFAVLYAMLYAVPTRWC